MRRRLPSAAITQIALAQALQLCERALRIDITLAEAERLWPHAPNDPYLAAVREDLLVRLEHVPTSRSQPDGDLDHWKRMPEYDDLVARVEQLRGRLAP